MRHFLDSGFLEDIPRSTKLYEQLRQFHWEYYSELAYQRSKIYDALKSSLRERAVPFDFSHWQRTVRYKYALDPLATIGSLRDPGGRFNIGRIDATRFPVFPALYVASDKGTAMAELLGRDRNDGSLTPEELALTKPESIAAVSVSGHVDAVLDICDERNLVGFVELIKGIRLSAKLISKAKSLGVKLSLINSAEQLSTVLCDTAWRNWPTLFDVPGTGQIFGRIVLDAQIEGILYKSVLTGRPCLAIFHQNFQNSASYVELDDPAPPEVSVRRIDSSNCKS